MSSTTFYLYWNCRQCGHKKIRGDNRICPKCNHQQDYWEAQEMEAGVSRDTVPESKADIITDAAELAAAKAGVDTPCNNCDASIPASMTTCWRCGAPKGATHEQIRELSKLGVVKAWVHEGGEDRSALVDELGGHEGRAVLDGRDAPHYGPATPSTPRPLPQELPRGVSGFEEPEVIVKRRIDTWIDRITPYATQRNAWIAFALAAVLAVVMILVWGLQTHEARGIVSGMHWQRTETVQRFTEGTAQDWQHNIREHHAVMPVNGRGEVAGADIESCYARHYDDEEYQCGTHTETKTRQVYDGQDCRTVTTAPTCSTVSNGNGTATRDCSGGGSYESCSSKYRDEQYTVDVPTMCTREIRKPWCTYTTWSWKDLNTAHTGGHGRELRWPGLTAGNLERIKRWEEYEVEVTVDDGDEKQKKSIEYADQESYLSWREDQAVVAIVNNFGQLREILPPRGNNL